VPLIVAHLANLIHSKAIDPIKSKQDVKHSCTADLQECEEKKDLASHLQKAKAEKTVHDDT